MVPLSDNAMKKRHADMLEVVEEVDPVGYLHIIIIGGLLLLKQMSHKMSRPQRVALTALTVLSGGALIGLLVYYTQTWLALVIVFALGFLVSEIQRL